MELTYHPDNRDPLMWYAITDDGGYDGSGSTPMDAVCALVLELESEIRKRDAEDGA